MDFPIFERALVLYRGLAIMSVCYAAQAFHAERRKRNPKSASAALTGAGSRVPYLPPEGLYRAR